MSLLWCKLIKKKLSKRKKKPSPTCQDNHSDSARNPKSSMRGYTNKPSVLHCSLKGTSLFASLSRLMDAGMTVEASIVLPLFLFFFLNLGCAIEMIRLHGNLQLALWQIGNRLSVYGYAVDSGEEPQSEEMLPSDEGGNEWWKELAGIAFSGTFVKEQIIRSAGMDYLNQSPLTKGAEGLQLWESRLFGSEDEISIVVTYSVSPWSKLVGFDGFRMSNQYYSHIWNGYRLTDNSGTESGSEEAQTVYVTETGRVYHITQDCTHLTLSTRPISAASIDGARNENGGKYYPCSRCAGGNATGVYYITSDGDRYHFDRGCSGLKRTVRAMPLDEAVESGYTPCSRCGR
ncbi:MAG TPA: hypothetical protein DCZ91_21615 [Lachnospiraceae bacterium]|nr:hypothetical protein [Lachnospiraceae bacterium]